jgi:dihydroorotase
MRLLIKKGRVLDPGSGADGILDILIADGRIEDIGPEIDDPDARLLDARGLVVCPGFIDMHVHLREPGHEHKETILSGMKAAAAGGFTTVCCMPNTNPPNDCREVTAYILDKSRESALITVKPIASISKGLKGEELSDMAGLAAAGAVAFSDDGQPVMNSLLMRRALEAARNLGKLVIDHCEDKHLSAGGVMHEGSYSRRYSMQGIPAASEEILVARDIILSRELGAPLHIAHASLKRTIEAVRMAKDEGVPVSCEVAPHHLFLTDSCLETKDPNFKVNPPLRSREDAEALIEAVRAGIVDTFATDHAPHTVEEKSSGFDQAPFGINGLETAVSVLLDRLVGKGRLSLGRFVEMLSTKPARLLGLGRKGRLVRGADADLTLLDLDKVIVVEPLRFQSKSRNTPFGGWKLRGAPVWTISAGSVVFPFEMNRPFPG